MILVQLTGEEHHEPVRLFKTEQEAKAYAESTPIPELDEYGYRTFLTSWELTWFDDEGKATGRTAWFDPSQRRIWNEYGVMGCGHAESAVITADEGTSFCPQCEEEARTKGTPQEIKLTRSY